MPVEVIGSAAVSSITSLSVVPLNPPPLLCDTPAFNDNLDIAKTLLLYSRWIHYTGQRQKEDVIGLYSRVRDLQPKWEKGYFYVAKYCDEVLVDSRKRQEDNFDLGPRVTSVSATVVSTNLEKRWWSYLPDVLLYYAKGLHRGHKNLFQALPRLLTLWFDFGSIYQRSGSSNNDMKNVHVKVVILVSRSYIFQNKKVTLLFFTIYQLMSFFPFFSGNGHHARVFKGSAHISVVNSASSVSFQNLPPK